MLSGSSAALFAQQVSEPTNPFIALTTSSGHQLSDLTDASKSGDVCVYWYIGPNGLKKGTIDFYRETLSRQIKAGATPCIVDLTSWGAFKGKGKLSDFHESALSLESEQLIAILARDYFAELAAIDADSAICQFISEITSRPALQKVSETHADTQASLGTLFSRDCPALAPILKLDCAKTYSVIQYIEFLFYTEMILKKKPDTQRIRYVLPNDEAKYYLHTLQHDLNTFLSLRGHVVNSLLVQIQCFEYGTLLLHRPYNIPSATIPRKKKLLPESVIDTQIIDSNNPRKK